MKKILFLPVFFAFVLSSYANELPNRSLYIEGTAEIMAYRAFFLDNFRMEAIALDFKVTDTRDEAEYVFIFNVKPFSDPYEPSHRHIINIILIDNATEEEMVSVSWSFAELEDMYEHNQYLFFSVVLLIPSFSEEEWASLIEAATPEPEIRFLINHDWKNQWLYLRTSFDYNIAFFALQPDGLIGGQGAYLGSFEDPDYVKDLDHIILPLPGFTLGAELQFLRFMSLELNFQANFGDPVSNLFFNMATGAQLKFNFKTNYFMFQPYGTFLYHINASPEFSEFPDYGIGGGIQAGVRGGRSGAFFLDVNYMHYFDDVLMINNNPLFPEPADIKFNRFVFGIGLGYKYGLFDRR